MRQHTDLCTQVEQNAMRWVLLHALNTVCTTSHMCGSRSCMEYINDLVVRGIAWPAAAVVCLFVVMIPSIITSMAGRTMWQSFDSRARSSASCTYPKSIMFSSRRDKLSEVSPFYDHQPTVYLLPPDEEEGGLEDDGMSTVPISQQTWTNTAALHQRRRNAPYHA